MEFQSASRWKVSPQRDHEEWDLDYSCFGERTGDAELGFQKQRKFLDAQHLDFESEERCVEVEIVRASDGEPMSQQMQDLIEVFSRCRAS